MPRILRAVLPALAILLLSSGVALGAVRGLVIKSAGSVVASVVDGDVTGELSIPPGETSGEFEIFWLDDNLDEYQPSSPPFTLGRIDANPTFVTTAATSTWGFTITGHDAGSSETVFQLLDNGTPVFVSAAVPSHSENAHVEADGFVLRQNGVTLTHVWRGVVTGGLPAHLGQTSPPIEVIFLSPDSVEFIPDEPEFELRLDIADSSVVKWRSLDQWSFELLGESLGSTTLTLNVHHVDHDDFVSPTLGAQTYGSLATDPVAGRSGLRLASPFPNPVRGDATIRFDLPRAEQAEVGVFDVTGRRVAELANGPRAAGSHSTVWNTSGIRPGLYLVRLRTPSGERTTRVTVSH